MKKYDSVFISIFITYILVLIAIIILALFPNYISIPACPIYTHLGIYCPACGGTRSIISLFHFDVVSSIWFNPIVLYSIVFATLYLINEFMDILFHKKVNLPYSIILKLGIFILVFNCIFKNSLILFHLL